MAEKHNSPLSSNILPEWCNIEDFKLRNMYEMKGFHQVANSAKQVDSKFSTCVKIPGSCKSSKIPIPVSPITPLKGYTPKNYNFNSNSLEVGIKVDKSDETIHPKNELKEGDITETVRIAAPNTHPKQTFSNPRKDDCQTCCKMKSDIGLKGINQPLIDEAQNIPKLTIDPQYFNLKAMTGLFTEHLAEDNCDSSGHFLLEKDIDGFYPKFMRCSSSEVLSEDMYDCTRNIQEHSRDCKLHSKKRSNIRDQSPDIQFKYKIPSPTDVYNNQNCDITANSEETKNNPKSTIDHQPPNFKSKPCVFSESSAEGDIGFSTYSTVEKHTDHIQSKCSQCSEASPVGAGENVGNIQENSGDCNLNSKKQPSSIQFKYEARSPTEEYDKSKSASSQDYNANITASGVFTQIASDFLTDDAKCSANDKIYSTDITCTFYAKELIENLSKVQNLDLSSIFSETEQLDKNSLQPKPTIKICLDDLQIKLKQIHEETSLDSKEQDGDKTKRAQQYTVEQQNPTETAQTNFNDGISFDDSKSCCSDGEDKEAHAKSKKRKVRFSDIAKIHRYKSSDDESSDRTESEQTHLNEESFKNISLTKNEAKTTGAKLMSPNLSQTGNFKTHRGKEKAKRWKKADEVFSCFSTIVLFMTLIAIYFKLFF